MPIRTPTPSTLHRLSEVTGAAHAIGDERDHAAYLHEPRGKWIGRAALVLLPATVEEVSRILAIANETGTSIVAQGGNTGLVGAQVPSASGSEVVVSLKRLNRIRAVDPVDNSITVEAGVTLKAVQEAADAVDRFFPLSLGSEGSCTIGGNLATNAGGVGVLAYGNARALALGLEVVLADGRVWTGLKRLRKDNTGYDLKDLFIGSEGTLGIITAATLSLFPKLSDRVTAWAGTPDPQKALDLLNLARELSAGRVTAMELMPRIGLEFTMRHAGVRDPLSVEDRWYVLMELSGSETAGTLRPVTERILEEALARGLVSDAVIAESSAQAAALWNIREQLPLVQKFEGGSLKHDVAVPVSRVPAFLDEAMAAVKGLVPGARPVPFGHIGDGNIHFNITQPEGGDTSAFLSRLDEVAAAVYRIVMKNEGSISAEHGIGRLKRDLMPSIKSPVELGLMRDLKRVLDPKAILNPGKVLPDA